MRTVRLGAFSPSVVLRLARHRGHLHAVGLQVEEVPVTSSPAQFRALSSGELDLAVTSPDNVLAYRFDGHNPLATLLDARIVAAVDRGLGLALYARPGVSDPETVRGAAIAVDVPTSGFALAAYALAAHLGLRTEDYTTVSLGSTPQRLQALLDGECEATMLNAGNELVAEEAGCVPLARVADVCAPYLGTVLAVVGDDHLDDAVLLSTALARATEEVLSGAASDDAATEAAAALGLSPRLALRYVERLRDPREGLVPGGAVDHAGLRTVVQLRRTYLPGGGDPDALAQALDPERGLVVRYADDTAP